MRVAPTADPDGEPEWLAAVRSAEGVDLLQPVTFEPGDRIAGAGEPGQHFLVVTDGEADVIDPQSGDAIARVGPWSILGELSLLTGARRTNDLRAVSALTGLVGDAAAFERALTVPAFRRHVGASAAKRLQAHARSVPVEDRHGRPLVLRPLLPTDRDAFLDGLAGMSRETLVNRFFTGSEPTSQVIDYLLDVDCVRHFAWVVIDPDADPAPGAGVGVARYVRDRTDPITAEFAITVVESARRRGIATLLLGALGVAATHAGVEQLSGFVRSQNTAMRTLLDGQGAHWERTEPGVVSTTLAATRLAELLDRRAAEELRTSVAAMMQAATLALA